MNSAGQSASGTFSVSNQYLVLGVVVGNAIGQNLSQHGYLQNVFVSGPFFPHHTVGVTRGWGPPPSFNWTISAAIGLQNIFHESGSGGQLHTAGHPLNVSRTFEHTIILRPVTEGGNINVQEIILELNSIREQLLQGMTQNTQQILNRINELQTQLGNQITSEIQNMMNQITTIINDAANPWQTNENRTLTMVRGGGGFHPFTQADATSTLRQGREYIVGHTNIPNPTQAGFTFAGWSSTQAHANGGQVHFAPGDRFTIWNNMTIFAVWGPNEQLVVRRADPEILHLHGFGGSMNDSTTRYFYPWDPSTLSLPTEAEMNAFASNPSSPNDFRGLNFRGWWTARTGGTQVDRIPLGTEHEVTYYARWSPA